MSSKTKQLGDVGEAIATAEFLKRGITVLKPVGDNESFDLVIILNGEFKKVQVKSTEKVINGSMIFRTNVTNPYKKTNRLYTKDEVDYFFLYCFENDWIGLLPFNNYKNRNTYIRIGKPKNNQVLGVKFASEYEIDNVIW